MIHPTHVSLTDTPAPAPLYRAAATRRKPIACALNFGGGATSSFTPYRPPSPPLISRSFTSLPPARSLQSLFEDVPSSSSDTGSSSSRAASASFSSAASSSSSHAPRSSSSPVEFSDSSSSSSSPSSPSRDAESETESSSRISLLSPPRSKRERADLPELPDLETITKKEDSISVEGIQKAPIQTHVVGGILECRYTFGGRSYTVRRIETTGQMNDIWEFRDDQEIVIKEKTLRTTQLILKTPLEIKKTDINDLKKAKRKRSNFAKELRETIKTFQHFQEETAKKTLADLGLSLPDYYFTPLDKDPVTGQQYAVWIVEKMAEDIRPSEWASVSGDHPVAVFKSLSPKNRKLLETVRKVLLYIQENSHDLATNIICRLDFHKGNVMFDSKGQVCYVDGNIRWDYDDAADPFSHAATWTQEWAKNPLIQEYLEMRDE